MADVEFDPAKFAAAAPAPEFDPAKFAAAKPTGAGPDYGGSQFKQMATDLFPEMGREFMAGARDVYGLTDAAKVRAEQGELGGLMNTARGVMGIPRMIASPATGAVNAILGHGLAGAEQAIGSVINPEAAARLQNDPQLYENAKSDVSKALMAAGAGKGLPPGGPAMALRPPTIGDFAVPLTEGEATGNAAQIAAERRAMRSGLSEPENAVGQQFLSDREARLAQVRSDISRGFSPSGQEIAQTPQEAAELAQAGVQREAQQLRAERTARYNEMANLPGEIHAGAFENIALYLRRRLSQGAEPVIIDDRTTPFASQALQDIDNNLNRMRIQNRAEPFSNRQGYQDLGPDEQIMGINLQGIDQQRKRLVQFYKDSRTYPPTADTRATRAVLGAFDDHVEDAIARGLFSGDPRALQALREARAAHSQYMRMFTPQGTGDDVGRFMQQILGSPGREAATPAEIANALYGVSKIGGKGLSVRLAGRLEQVLGRNSPEMIGVRQGLWRRMTENVEGAADYGPQRVVNNISHFLNGDGQAMAERMFTPAQRDLIGRYRDVLQQTIPPPGAVNYSNNVPMLSALRHGVTRAAMTLLGSHVGGMVGAAAGYAAHVATTPISNAMKARKLAQQMPTLAESMRRWNQAMVKAQAGTASPEMERAARIAMLGVFNKAGITEDELMKP